MAKIDRIIDILETRIARGDYAMTLFPTEYGLAEEMSVGRMTARRAILRLVEKGLLYRDSSGRLAVTAEMSEKRPLQIGFLTGTTINPSRWQEAANLCTISFGGHMRAVNYFHWDDPVLLEACESFDGIFLVPPAEQLLPELAERLLNSRARIVMLGHDYSSIGLRSVDNVSSGSVDALLDHLATLGHRQISVLSTQPVVPAIEERLEDWQRWISAHQCGGELINEPEASYGFPMQRAYDVALERFSSGRGLGGTAVLCTTLPTTLGLMRAANECGLVIGQDISICTVNDEGLARYLNPTLTSTQTLDPMTYLRDCVEWMAGGEWVGPLLKEPNEVELFVGKSTGPSFGLAVTEQMVDTVSQWNEPRRIKKALTKVA